MGAGKFTDLPDAESRDKAIKELEFYAQQHIDVLRSADKQVSGYIFALNSGGLAAALAYLASKPSTSGTLFALACFALGTLLILLHAMAGHYRAETAAIECRDSLEKYLTGQTDRSGFIKSLRSRWGPSSFALYMGWLSALFFVMGLISGVAILFFQWT